MSNASPCSDICSFDPRNKWCVGCGRTANEIKAWKKMSPFHKASLSADLKRRMQKLNSIKPA
jgi:predicted Fe-S protein YdhL (DUF1289 family)